MLAAFGIPLLESSFVRNELIVAEYSLAQALRRAQVLSATSQNDSSWGVYVQNNSITLFQGAGYLVRDSAADEVTPVPSSITPSGTQEIVFSKLTGRPQMSGAITLSTDTQERRTIIINAYGMVEY